ncbi:MAG: hypothetical protein WC785_00885 [Tatlockia sp.]|jgi:hypothetical protein
MDSSAQKTTFLGCKNRTRKVLEAMELMNKKGEVTGHFVKK